MSSESNPRFASFVYRFRWPLSLLALVLTGAMVTGAGGRIGTFTERITSLGDTSNGSGNVPPLIFDPRMDLWFGSEDEAVDTYHEIEERFVAEDYIMLAFGAPERDFGVFDREALATTARLTNALLRVPGVRHVRSLTSNPWIRYGEIVDEAGSERGLLISDLVEGDPTQLSDEAIIERMVAVLGARRTADRIGEDRVRSVLGEEADFANFIGEPLLLGTIVDDVGSTTAIQVQVLRPRVDEDALEKAFGAEDERAAVATTLYSVQAQRAALRGIEHVLRQERGLAPATPEHAQLSAWIAGLPDGERRRELALELADPNRNFMPDASGASLRKYYEYDAQKGGGYVDSSDPAQPVTAPGDFKPQPRSPFEFHVGGVPLFERNFEEVA